MAEVIPFETVQLTLTGRDGTGDNLTCNAYTLQGVTNADGSLRVMSIAELCMAVCLQRAADVEEDLIELMNKMAENSADLSALSDVEQQIAQKYNASTGGSDEKFTTNTLTEDAYDRFKDSMGTSSGTWTCDDATRTITVTASNVESFLSEVEEAMDTLNTSSQEMLIDIESYTAKRDDTYSLVSNLTKSCYQACAAIANNLP